MFGVNTERDIKINEQQCKYFQQVITADLTNNVVVEVSGVLEQ